MPDNRPMAEDAEPGTCPILMSDDEPCGRPILGLKPAGDEFPVCLMHSCDPNKSNKGFQKEISAIFGGISKYQRHNNRHDFTSFIFVESPYLPFEFTLDTYFSDAVFYADADFSKKHFTKLADFMSATFNGKADFKVSRFKGHAEFYSATFHKSTDFEQATFELPVDFEEAKFYNDTSFMMSTFESTVNFSLTNFFGTIDFTWTTFQGDIDLNATIFHKEAEFRGTWFLGISTFSHVVFHNPKQLRFELINRTRIMKKYTGPEPEVEKYPVPDSKTWKVRFIGSRVDQVEFEDVAWFQSKKKLTLQDEFDLGNDDWVTHELVGAAYRRLSTSFEASCQYDWAEDCFVGAMEMKRLDPSQPLSRRIVTTLYKWASEYGSNYARTIVVLFILLGFFGILYSLPGFGLMPTNDMAFLEGPYLESGYSWQRLLDGILYAFEVITFTREPTFTVTNYLGKAVRIAETILVPGQLALFFLALRRRFRR